MYDLHAGILSLPHSLEIREFTRDTLTFITHEIHCVFALSLLLALRMYRKFVYRLAMYQIIGSLFQSSAMMSDLLLWNYNKNLLYYQISCKFCAFITQLSLWVKLMLTVQLTFHLFCYVVFYKNLKRLEKVYIAVSTILPSIIACIPFFNNTYCLTGPGAWCYISSKVEGDCAAGKSTVGVIEQFVLYYGPATFLLTLNVVLIILVIILFRRHKYRFVSPQDRSNWKQVLRQTLPLLVYPAIYFTMMLLPLTNRIYMAVSASDSTNYNLLLVHSVAFSCVGFFAGLALLAHICSVQLRKWQLKRTRCRAGATIRPARVSNYLATFDGLTPYTSGAETKFSLPNETEVDAAWDQGCRTGKRSKDTYGYHVL